MLKNVLVFTFVLLTLSGCEFSDNKNESAGVIDITPNKATFSGLAQLKEMTYSNLTVNGTAKLDNVLVAEKLGANGFLSATKMVSFKLKLAN